MSTVQVRETGIERSEVPEPRRLVDQFPTWLVNTVTALGFTIPTVAYFWVIAHFGVNLLFADQLTDVDTISVSKTQVIPWGTLWAPHNHNRMLFPHLLDIALGGHGALQHQVRGVPQRNIARRRDGLPDPGAQASIAPHALALLLPGGSAVVVAGPIPEHPVGISDRAGTWSFLRSPSRSS